MSAVKTLPNAFIIGATGACGKCLLFQLLKTEPCPFEKLTVFSRRSLVHSYPEIKEFPNYSKLEETILEDFDVFVQAAANVTGESESIFRRPITSMADRNSPIALSEEQEAKLRSTFQTADVGFSCLGTTKRAMPKEADYWRVDVEYPVAVANYWQAVRQKEREHKSHLLVVSSAGADPGSWFRYTKWKGELEQALARSNVEKLCLLRPGFLIPQEERSDKRILESSASGVMWLLDKIVPNKLQIAVSHVTIAMKKLAFGPLPHSVDEEPLIQYKSNPQVCFPNATVFENLSIYKLATSST